MDGKTTQDLMGVTDTTVRIPMRDGITLSARLWLPHAIATNIPTIIEAIPYRKSDGTVARDASTHGIMVKAGYACLRVDLRGTGSSAGFFDDEYSEQELEDIEDVVAWAVAARWSNGAAGIMGISWGGINALLTAARRPKGLKAVIAAAAVLDRFDEDIHFKGGCELTSNFGWAAQAMSVLSLPPDPATVEGDWLEVWKDRLGQTVFLPELWSNGAGRTPYWSRTALEPGDIDIPVLAIAGHRDGYRNLPSNLLSAAGPNSKAILGPWDHNYPNISSFGPWLDFADLAVRWWDHWLKGMDRGVSDDPALRIFVVDGAAPADKRLMSGQWTSLRDWPSDAVRQKQLFLADGGLMEAAQPIQAPIRPNLNCGAAAGEFFSRSGAPDLHPADQFEDDLAALCFDSKPFDAATILLGDPEIALQLSSDCPVGQIVVRLSDVSPDGRSRLITMGALDLSYRQGLDAPRPVPVGEVIPVSLRFDSVGYKLAKGHALRVAVSSSYWPFIWPVGRVTQLTLHGGAVTLPVFEGSEVGTFQGLDVPPTASAVVDELSPPDLSTTWLRDGDRIVRDRRIDTGRHAFSESGLIRGGSMSEQMSVDPDDPASAQMHVTWRGSIDSHEISTETVWQARMRADAKNIHLWGRLEAFNEGERIFTRDFSSVVPREIDQSAVIDGGPNPKKTNGEDHG
ncbi:MAG: CocE/NonD family hydrolase [Pseudomonadota bacterium]